jgi:hypothetical protein
MEKDQNQFELVYKEKKVNVQRHSVGKDVIFRIIFEDRKQPLVITRATHASTNRFWTSIPEGRQTEAEEIGALISEYFKSSQ